MVCVPAVNLTDGSGNQFATSGNPAFVTSTSTLTVNVAQINGNTPDPCSTQTKLMTPIAAQGGLVSVLVPGVSSKKVYVCSVSLIAPIAQQFSFIEGASSSCVGSQAAVLGGTTALSGLSVPANGGLTLGNGGASVAQTATAANYLCLTTSLTPTVAGNLSYVQQ